MPEQGEQRLLRLHDQADRKQKDDAHQHGKRQPDPPCAGLHRRIQFARDNRQDNNIVDPEHNLQARERD